MADVTSPFGFRYPEGTDLVRNGATDIQNLATDVNDYLGGGYLYAGTRYYTSSGTFAKADPLGTGDIGLRAIRVRMVGGGGGGGGCATTGAGQVAIGRSGSGSTYAESFILASALTASVTVTRGGGGAGGVGPTGSGSNGATSEFGAGETFEVSAQGGIGGASGGAASPPITQFATGGREAIQGSTATGDFIIDGGSSEGRASTFATVAHIGAGGGNALAPLATTTPATGGGINGLTPGSPGCGGTAGANSQSQGTARDGGAGSDGIIIVDCFV